MDPAKRARLEKEGWQFGDAADFLDLTPEEAAFVELKLALVEQLKQLRIRTGWTQIQLAVKIGSSQSRVAKMEAGDASVSVDLLIRTLLALGASREDLGSAIGRASLSTGQYLSSEPMPHDASMIVKSSWHCFLGV